jgi:Predicted membrane protein
MNNKGNTVTTKGLTQLALFSALIIIMAFVPFLGYIPLGFTRATIIHIPVIIGSLMLGAKKGAVLGGVFGLTSLINNSINPTITSFVFTPFYSLGDYSGGWQSLVICFVPRILIGVVPFYVYRLIVKSNKDSKGPSVTGLVAAGLSGALTNTLLVMNMIYLFFGNSYAAAREVAADTIYKVILSVITINGIPEAIVAAIIVSLVGKVIMNKKVMDNIGA